MFRMGAQKVDKTNESQLELIRQAIRDKRCVPVVGAGASIAAGGPSSEEYLSKLAEDLPDYARRIVENSPYSDPTELVSWLTAERDQYGLDPTLRIPGGDPGPVHEALARWRCPLYVTTNFDGRIEGAVRKVMGDAEEYSADQL